MIRPPFQIPRICKSGRYDRPVLVVVLVVSLLMLIGASYDRFIAPPPDFPAGHVVTVTTGQTLQDVSSVLRKADVVRSPFAFRMTATLLGGERGMVAGQYYFQEPVSVLTVARRIERGDTRYEPRSITIPEGATLYRIAQLLDYNIVEFDPVAFLKYAHGNEGFLFPDTYQFRALADERAIVQRMRETFRKRIEPLTDRIRASDRSLAEIVIMASILEKEVATTQDRRKVAGVLWNRIDQGMPLQVDAAFSHVNGKTTYELTLDDLRTDAPFNTYTNKGLPPHPIANPGLDSIKAALNPIRHNYLYYLSDRRGNTYYSETFEEHKRLKARYIN